MNVGVKVETALTKYHLLHLVIGAVIGGVMLAIPKLAVIVLAVFCIAMLLPSVLMVDFPQSKWLDRLAVIVGAVVVAIVFHLLGKL